MSQQEEKNNMTPEQKERYYKILKSLCADEFGMTMSFSTNQTIEAMHRAATTAPASQMEQLIEKIKLKADSWDNSTKETRARKGAYVDCLILAKDILQKAREL